MENVKNVVNANNNDKKNHREFIQTPEHIVNIALIIRNNAEIRRFTALGIINYLSQKGEIKGKKNYVSFKFNKFSVKSDGLAREYFYTEGFFLNALVASFASFSASAQRTIDKFIRTELNSTIHDTVDSKDVEEIVNSVSNNIASDEVVESAE